MRSQRLWGVGRRVGDVGVAFLFVVSPGFVPANTFLSR
jgi:hypothetical protein